MADEEVKPDPDPNPNPSPNLTRWRSGRLTLTLTLTLPNQVKVAAEREAGLVRRCRELEEEVRSTNTLIYSKRTLICTQLYG